MKAWMWSKRASKQFNYATSFIKSHKQIIMSSNYQQILCFILMLPLGLSAQYSEEIEALEAKIRLLQAENTELKLKLAESDVTIEEQNKSLSHQEQRIVAFRESEQAARAERRRSSGSDLGRDRGPGGAIALGPFTFGGAIRANYTSGDYDNEFADGVIDGPSRDNGTVLLDTLIFNTAYDTGNWMGAAEYRFYDNINSFGGTHFLHTLWMGKRLNDGSELKAGIVEVPFGLERFGAAYGYFNHLDYYVGLADDRDLGITYGFSLSDWDIDIGYFLGSEPEGSGESRNSARGSYDVVTPSDSTTAGDENNFLFGNFSPWEEGSQFNLRVKKQFYRGDFNNTIGASLQYGELESTDPLERFEDGEMHAGSIFFKSTFGNWQIKVALTKYEYDIDQLKDGSIYLGYNPDQIVMGGTDTPYFVASRGNIQSVGLSYTHYPRNIDYIDYIVPYLDYSKINKDGETNGQYFFLQSPGFDYKDSEQISFGSIIGMGNMIIYMDLLFGKGAPMIGNNNSQYFTGASLNGPPSAGAEFDDGWQHRFNINFGYYY